MNEPTVLQIIQPGTDEDDTFIGPWRSLDAAVEWGEKFDRMAKREWAARGYDPEDAPYAVVRDMVKASPTKILEAM